LAKKKYQPGICIYCGKHSDLTEEHVFARAFFPEDSPRPSKPVIVPICKPCNDQKGGDESYMRDFLNLDPRVATNPIVRRNIDGPIRRSILGGHSQFFKTTLHRGRPVDRYTDGGIYLGVQIAMPFLRYRASRWLQLVGRGLYYHHMGNRVPDDYSIDTSFIKDNWREWAYNRWREEGAPAPHLMGTPEERTGQVVTWTYLINELDPFRSTWLLWFYETIYFSISILKISPANVWRPAPPAVEQLGLED
jgi:hypothetical protein